MSAAMMTRAPLEARIDAFDWTALAQRLSDDGFARLPALLDAEECSACSRNYADDALFRSTVNMQRHGFGRGEYRYYAYPLPSLVAALRSALYRRLAPLANRWNDELRVAERYPSELEEYLTLCAAADQKRPTPLILRYGPGDYNALHQDLYGERAFPFQVTCYLSERSAYEGGETILAFQRPRSQTVARALSFERGEALIVANRYRPVRGTRGTYRENVRHGVSDVRAGERFALGIIFHDAR
jgi:hypothetical protein